MKKSFLDVVLITTLSFLTAFSLGWQHHFLFLFIGTEILFWFLWDKLEKINCKRSKGKIEKKEFLLYGSIIIISLIFGFLAYCPGNITFDSYNQWNQVQTNTYNNWHPVLHTLFSFKLPSLFFNHLVSCTLFQMAIIFGILLYFCYFCRKNFLNFPMTLFVLLTITLNPLFLIYSVSLWKDIPFSWCMFLDTLFLIDIVITNGDWLKKNSHKIWFIVTSFGIFVFRHNGIVPFFFLFLFLIIFYPKTRKFTSLAFISILLVNLIIVGPIYKTFHINRKTGGKAEMAGMVMANISYYYNNAIHFTNEELEVLNTITPLENWEKNYNPKNFNKTKNAIEDYHAKVTNNFDKIIKLWFQKSQEHPVMFLKSFTTMSSPIWETTLSFQGAEYSVRYEEGQETNKMKLIRNFFQKNLVLYNQVVTKSPFRVLFMNIGQGLLFTVYALAIIIKKVKTDFKKYLPFILVLANSGVMMLLITGEEYRFVYYQSLCVIPLLLYSIYSNPSKVGEKNV